VSRKYLLDTGPAHRAIFRIGTIHERIARMRQAGLVVGICPPVAGEIWAGVESSTSRDKNLVIVRRNIRLFKMWPYSAKAAEEYGRISAYLKSVGRPIQKIDMQLAAVALTLGDCTVVTNDTDLTAVPGLTLES
jgi:tRNA(fMet)-specific endonuclease VapC